MWGRVLDWTKGLELVTPLANAANTTMDYLNVPFVPKQIVKGFYSGLTKGVIPLFRIVHELKTDTAQTIPITYKGYNQAGHPQEFNAGYDPSKIGWVNISQTILSLISCGLEIAALCNQPADPKADASTSHFLLALSIFANAASLCLLKYKETLKEHHVEQAKPTALKMG